MVGVIVASRQVPVTWRLLVVVAFSSARWAALAFNMLADVHFDRANPRNQRRELALSVLSVRQAESSFWPQAR